MTVKPVSANAPPRLGRRASLSLCAGGLCAGGLLAACTGTGRRPSGGDATLLAAVQEVSIAETLRQSGRFERFLRAAEAQGFMEVLSRDGPLTVFAPLDIDSPASEPLPAGAHIAPGQLVAADLRGIRGQISMLDGRLVPVDLSGERGIGGKASLVQTDVRATNGIIHIIDRPL